MNWERLVSGIKEWKAIDHYIDNADEYSHTLTFSRINLLYYNHIQAFFKNEANSG
jgi:hypothetical protein